MRSPMLTETAVDAAWQAVRGYDGDDLRDAAAAFLAAQDRAALTSIAAEAIDASADRYIVLSDRFRIARAVVDVLLGDEA